MEAMAPLAMYTYDDAGVTNDNVAELAAGVVATGAGKLKSELVRGVRGGAIELAALQISQTIEGAPKYPAPLADASTPV